MPLPQSIKDREYNKFVEDDNGDVAVRVAGGAGDGSVAVEEQRKPTAEDNIEAVIAGQYRPLVSTEYKTEIYKNWGSAITQNIKASEGAVFTGWGKNDNASVVYLQFHNTAGVPAGAAVPLISIPIPASSIWSFDKSLIPNGVNFSNGIAIAWSTTEATYTAVALATTQSANITFL